MGKRLTVFDWIRSIAILIVLFHHLPEYTFNFYDLNFLGVSADLSTLNKLNGYFGLSLFVFSSGYLTNIKKPLFSSLAEVKKFALQRFVRIFPLYYLALLLFCSIFEIRKPVTILIQIFGLQLVVSNKHIQPIFTLWFIGLIVVYYAVFILVKISKLSVIARILLVGIIQVVFLLVHQYFGLTDFRLALYYPVFMFGVLCSERDILNPKVGKLLSYASIFLLFTSLLVLWMLLEDLIGNRDLLLMAYLLLNIFMISFIVLTYKVVRKIAGYLQFKNCLEALAYSSYCMYLLHRPIWWPMQHILRNSFSIKNDFLILAILIVIGLPLIFLISYALQVTYDKYFRHHVLTLLS